MFNENFEYFCKKFLSLSPRLKDEEVESVYQKFVEFYLNGTAVLSQQNAHQLIEVSHFFMNVLPRVLIFYGDL
jgi:hypothetical protein